VKNKRLILDFAQKTREIMTKVEEECNADFETTATYFQIYRYFTLKHVKGNGVTLYYSVAQAK
jgi:hypothetical protein